MDTMETGAGDGDGVNVGIDTREGWTLCVLCGMFINYSNDWNWKSLIIL